MWNFKSSEFHRCFQSAKAERGSDARTFSSLDRVIKYLRTVFLRSNCTVLADLKQNHLSWKKSNGGGFFP